MNSQLTSERLSTGRDSSPQSTTQSRRASAHPITDTPHQEPKKTGDDEKRII